MEEGVRYYRGVPVNGPIRGGPDDLNVPRPSPSRRRLRRRLNRDAVFLDDTFPRIRASANTTLNMDRLRAKIAEDQQLLVELQGGLDTFTTLYDSEVWFAEMQGRPHPSATEMTTVFTTEYYPLRRQHEIDKIRLNVMMRED